MIDWARYAHVFKNGSLDDDARLPETEQVHAATFVGDVLLYGGGGSAVYAYNVVTGQAAPGLALTGLQATAGVAHFGTLSSMAYDPVGRVLYLGGNGGYVAAFPASHAATAFPEEMYDYRTMSKARLQAEALDAPAGNLEHSFKVVVSARQPGAAQLKTLTFVEERTHQSLYRVEEPFMSIASIAFDARAGEQQYRYQVWMPSSEAQGGGIPVAMKVGSVDYSLAVSSLGGDAVAVFVTPAVASAARVSDGTLSRQIDVRYADGRLHVERLPVGIEPGNHHAPAGPGCRRRFRRGRRQGGCHRLGHGRVRPGSGANPVAQAGNTDRWPLAKVPIVKMTQAQYNAAVAANTIAAGQNVIYVIVG